MSKLEELINEYCPDGVEYRKLDDCIRSLKTGLNPRKNFVLNAEGNTCPYITGKDVFNNRINVTERTALISDKDVSLINKRANIENGDVLFVSTGTGTVGRLAIVDNYNDDWAVSETMYMLKPEHSLIGTKYLLYSLSSTHIKKQYEPKISKGSVPHLKTKDLLNVILPVPPLEVQREIVRILDNYSAVVAEMKDRLDAELTARKKQYEYYKDGFFVPENIQAPIMKLNDIANIYDGTHQTPKYSDSGVPFISVENIGDIYGSMKYISKEDYSKYKIKPQVGDVFMTRIGSIGKCAVLDYQSDLAYYVSLALIRPNQDIIRSKYLKYVIESGVGAKELYKRTLINAVPIKINKVDIGKIALPVPSLEVQDRIIKRLAIYDTICADIVASLPTEIEARQKQYEYYRDKLLTFKEKKQ